jgi:hypothetical protein
MSISEHFRYRNEVFQSDIFVSDIGITDVDVGCRILLTLRSMSMPTYGYCLERARKPATTAACHASTTTSQVSQSFPANLSFGISRYFSLKKGDLESAIKYLL